jgi:hypothetical protein
MAYILRCIYVDPAPDASYATTPCPTAHIAAPPEPADFGKFIADETEMWGKVVRFANIKVE